ncbi:MAG: 3'-5' exoribonuclease [Clostridia bacterium]|nr:3'-5' exoribonuclease [Clostridia bacterium]
MFTVKSHAEFLSDVRSVHPSVKNMRLNQIEIDRENKKITYRFICDQTVSEEVKDLILSHAEKITLPAFKVVVVTVKKISCDSEIICKDIYDFLSTNYPSVSIYLKPTDLSCKYEEGVVRYNVKLTKDGVEYVQRNGTLKKLNAYLGNRFCADFIGSTEEKHVEETISLLSDEVYESELQKIEYRTIKVEDVVEIDDENMGDIAFYIEDLTEHGNYTVCGTVTEITEKTTKNGKPMFIIHIDDTTGKLSGIYFSKKSTLQKIRDIPVGECIIARGTLGEYNGKNSFTFEKINRCFFPKNFVKKPRFEKSAPKNYSLVYPSPAKTVKVSTVFDNDFELPDELTSQNYVVFDLETTGLELMSNGITEIGAVKIINGKIAEQFTTLINPEHPISEENVKITGITYDMVKDCPKIKAVIPDFMKFIEGSVLVAQNAEFDMKFIKRFAGAEDYKIKNKVMDTMELSRKYLPQLRKNDLHTLAEHFGIVFHHHRALSDAYATAEIFIELLKIKAKSGK